MGREKGKRIERWFANNLKDIWPKIRRNAGSQAQSGGVDLENTGRFDIEIKGGQAYKLKRIRYMIEQTQRQGREDGWKLLLVKPDREEPYAIIPFDDLLNILQAMKSKEII